MSFCAGIYECCCPQNSENPDRLLSPTISTHKRGSLGYQSSEPLDSNPPSVPLSTVKNDEEFDTSSSVFQGLEVQLKFTSKSVFETKFVWINNSTKTIHMSQFLTKDRRHKEASLSEITSVTIGAPDKLKNNSPAFVQEMTNLCLTINFVKGGGIDLLFPSEVDRNEWFVMLNKIIIGLNGQAAAV